MACKAKCCQGNTIVVTEVGYNKIVDANHPDYFHPVELPQGNFYVLDHVFNRDGKVNPEGKCPYLQNNKCSIEDVKPDTCAVFPMVRKIDYTGFFKGVAFSTTCPAAAIAEKIPSFKEHALSIVEKRNIELPASVEMAVVNQHRNILMQKVRENNATNEPVAEEVIAAELPPLATIPFASNKPF